MPETFEFSQDSSNVPFSECTLQVILSFSFQFFSFQPFRNGAVLARDERGEVAYKLKFFTEGNEVNQATLPRIAGSFG